MLRGGNVRDILQMRQEGLSVTEISRLTGLDRKTISKYALTPQVPEYGPREKRPRKLDPHKPYIEQRLKEGVWNAVVLQKELKEQGYTGGYSCLKEYLSPRREAARTVAVQRFETGLGQQAQVDWGSVGSVETGDSAHPKRALSAFVMTLGCSRALFAGIAQDQTVETLLRMHEEAFRQLGGVPQEILYDRPRTILLGVDGRGELKWNSTFLDFTKYWGYVPRVCRGYRPQTKGKVESGVKYLKGNFLCGRSATSVEDLASQLSEWMQKVANARVHGTTYRVVSEAHAEEKPYLQPIGLRPPFPLPEENSEAFATRRVATDAYINYRASRYSVPFRAVGQDVIVREVDGKLQISLADKHLAEHALSEKKHQTITVTEHVEGIPLGPSSRARTKNQVHIRPSAPEVEVRPLAQYEAVAMEGQIYHG